MRGAQRFAGLCAAFCTAHFADLWRPARRFARPHRHGKLAFIGDLHGFGQLARLLTADCAGNCAFRGDLHGCIARPHGSRRIAGALRDLHSTAALTGLHSSRRICTGLGTANCSSNGFCAPNARKRTFSEETWTKRFSYAQVFARLPPPQE